MSVVRRDDTGLHIAFQLTYQTVRGDVNRRVEVSYHEQAMEFTVRRPEATGVPERVITIRVRLSDAVEGANLRLDPLTGAFEGPISEDIAPEPGERFPHMSAVEYVAGAVATVLSP
jgi:hypothetical protein